MPITRSAFVIRAHNAADWQVFEANRDIMPNLRWLPTTAAEPEAGHRAYWVARLNLPIDDPFWQHHHPGDHWNCKCSLEQNNDPVARPSDIPGGTFTTLKPIASADSFNRADYEDTLITH